MSTPVILVIDDSATIRKMVDSHLSQEGYRVVLAATGEAGVELAREVNPDLILLDHQLPGTTGIEVCRKIIAFEECRHIPFVVSSTLRKQAYIEYMDVPNVVDSLPKPFKAELLKMSVANALETATMIMASQSGGTAVPEVVDALDQPAFSGDLRWLSLREVIDFLNNGRKDGLLEVETDRNRVSFYLKHGRIQGVASASFDPQTIVASLPDSLQDLAPLLQFTMSSGQSTQASGLVELMDKKMLDPRMLRALLRHQAAVLTHYCFHNKPTAFSFLPERTPPALLAKVPIDCCLAAVLIDAAMALNQKQNPTETSSQAWIRNALRGQNLDRTGLGAKHIQLLSLLDSSARTTSQLADRSGLSVQEAAAVLAGLQTAEWIESSVVASERTVIAFQPHAAGAVQLREIIEAGSSGWTGNVVRDDLSFHLLLKRKSPQALIIALQGDDELDLPPKLNRQLILQGPQHVVLLAAEGCTQPVATDLQKFAVVRGPVSSVTVLAALNSASQFAAASPSEPGQGSQDCAADSGRPSSDLVLESAGAQ